MIVFLKLKQGKKYKIQFSEPFETAKWNLCTPRRYAKKTKSNMMTFSLRFLQKSQVFSSTRNMFLLMSFVQQIWYHTQTRSYVFAFEIHPDNSQFFIVIMEREIHNEMQFTGNQSVSETSFIQNHQNLVQLSSTAYTCPKDCFVFYFPFLPPTTYPTPAPSACPQLEKVDILYFISAKRFFFHCLR